jgi:hypothetical protein
MELEERSLADLPDRCESCGATLTDLEKQAALERGTTPVLCTTCATEAETAFGEDGEDEDLGY